MAAAGVSFDRRAPKSREPRLTFTRQTFGTVVMFELDEAGSGKIAAPRREIPVGAVSLLIPAFLIVAARIRAEQHTARLERGTQLAEHPWQLHARHVKQHGVGEDSV